MKPINPQRDESLMDLGKRCNAVYVCPKIDGVRKGPLVAYAGKDIHGKNYVGDLYFNFRRIERHPKAVAVFAENVCIELRDQNLLDSFDVVCGIPHGGRTLGQLIALCANKQFVYADKKPKPTEPGKKQEYSWDMSQFDLEPGVRVAVAEDVFNNFQNTENTLAAINGTGAQVVLLVGALNRSPIYDGTYTTESGIVLPVVASIREAFPEYAQHDQAVAADIAAGNVEYDVKKNWAKLCACMQ